jgi:hypothetical protein
MPINLEGRARWVRRTIPRDTLFVQGVIQNAKTDEDIRREEKARKNSPLPSYVLIIPEKKQIRARAYFPAYSSH